MPRTELDGEAVVDTVWGLDGPYTAHDLGQAMLALQHLVRYSNHATLNAPRTVLAETDDVATVVRRLGDALGGLDQLLDQLADRCDHIAADPTLKPTDWQGAADPPLAAASAGVELRAVAAAAATMRDRMQRASSAMGSIYLDTEDGR
ncbi:hypothetical protein [Nocardia asteroides]|uniref:hypothetical protein n=1 Tax=Nocardia asteroides TaxID=1824 RepID=UPI001E284F49|nr:hypothetical protein [Nocardia asteroides]UGT58801.1 hypothetical protein LTT85_33155 [Nocardia asteroides]